MPFGHDAFLWYSVGAWAPLGLAVPNWSDDVRSQNSTIRYLVENIGRNLQAIMIGPDARVSTPPSFNTVLKIHALCDRIRTILASRAKAENELLMESSHAIPAAEDFLVFPTPYFKVRNPWLKDYAAHALLAMTEAMQHSENDRPLEITVRFAGQVGQYFQRVLSRMAVELFLVDKLEAAKPDFRLSDAVKASYNPSKVVTSTELLDVVPRFDEQATEDDLQPLSYGIPISQLPVLQRWPTGPVAATGGSTGTAPAPAASAAFVTPPGP